MWFYRRKKYYKQTGLRQCRWLLRRHNDKDIILLMENWWGLINKYSIRDQLSLPFCIWRHNTKTKLIPSDLSGNFFDVNPHLSSLTRGNGLIPYSISLFWNLLAYLKSIFIK